MITEIELSEIVSQLASKSKKQIEIYEYSYLRSIGDYIEKNDSSCRVSMNTCSYHTFQSRSPRRIVVEEERIIVRGLQTPINPIDFIIRKYASIVKLLQIIGRNVCGIKNNSYLWDR